VPRELLRPTRRGCLGHPLVYFPELVGEIQKRVERAWVASARVRLVHVTSPISVGYYATLTAAVSPSRSCSITVYYKSGPSHAQGLYSKRPSGGRVSWT
jgi:hypothetical protein